MYDWRRFARYVRLAGLALAAGVAGCAGTPETPGGTQGGKVSDSRYTLQQDRGPAEQVDLSKIPDAVPRWDPPAKAGNKSPYQVWGKTYRVLATSQGYWEAGVASWYGKKFHGHRTANGETYDMYAMSAAHKSLPLPSYAMVKNLENGRQVLVRVNDRGPFHDGRLIDLSYAAAARLDMLNNGTARVEVTAIDPRTYVPSTEQARAAAVGAPPPAPLQQPRRYLQIGAFSQLEAAQRVQQRVQPLVAGVPVRIQRPAEGAEIYRVQLGPLAQGTPLEEIYQRLKRAGFAEPIQVDLP